MITREDIAKMLGITVQTFRNRVEPRPDFPRPVIATSRKTVRWNRDDVVAWLPCLANADTPEPKARKNNELLVSYRDIDQEMRDYLCHKFQMARRRAVAKGETPSLTTTDVLALYRQQQGRCAVSGLQFRLDGDPGRARPFAPSIDRIKSNRAYELGNVRLVCSCINMLMNEWGDSVYATLAAHIRGAH